MSRTPAKPATRKYKRHSKKTWSCYIHRAVRAINKQISMSSRTMKIMNSFVTDMFERIAVEAAGLVRSNKKTTFGSREVQTAVRLILPAELVLPAELAKHAMAEATRAVAKINA